jgi:hypothetical protein
MAELRAFYAAVLPHLRAAIAYLDGRRDQGLGNAEQRLLRIILGSTEAAQAVEVFQQPDVPGRDDTHPMSIKWTTYSMFTEDK